jgi:hypothetical protein
VTNYRVIWEIDIDAETPEDAAREALEIQRDPVSRATAFRCFDENGDCSNVDVTQLDEKEF